MGALVLVGSVAGVLLEDLGLPGWVDNAVFLLLLPFLMDSPSKADEVVPQRTPPQLRSEADVDALLSLTPALTRRSLRPQLGMLVLGVPTALGIAALSAAALVYGSQADDQTSVWFFRSVGALGIMASGYAALVALPRRYLQARAVVRDATRGAGTRHAAVVVGEQDDAPILELFDGEGVVVLRPEAKVVQLLAQGDLVVLDGPLICGHMVAVSAGGRFGWTRFRDLEDEPDD